MNRMDMGLAGDVRSSDLIIACTTLSSSSRERRGCRDPDGAWVAWSGDSWPCEHPADEAPGGAPSPSSATPTPARPRSPRSSCSTAAPSQRGRRGARRASGRRAATSDWMALEQQRGHLDHVDGAAVPVPRRTSSTCSTPPATATSPRTPTACSPRPTPRSWCSTSAKGIEPQTLKLFEVCRDRGLPAAHFLNKYDRPGRDAARAARRDRAADRRCVPTPVTWPVGIAGDFRGVIDRRDGEFIRFTRTAGGATEAAEEVVDAARAAAEEGAAWAAARRRAGAARRASAPTSTLESFLAGRRPRCSSAPRSPTSACGCCSTRVVDLAPGPSPRPRRSTASPRPLDAPFSASCSRCRRTWTRAPRSHRVRPRSARAASSAAWW